MTPKDAYQHLVEHIKSDIDLKTSQAVSEAIGTQPIAILTPERFSELSGIEVGVIKGWIQKGHIDSVKIGRRRLVNHAAITAYCIKNAH